MKIFDKCSCYNTSFNIKYASSNDYVKVGFGFPYEVWLSAKAISITDAVNNHGWRVLSRLQGYWKKHSSKEMQEEYLAVFEKDILNELYDLKNNYHRVTKDLLEYRAFDKNRDF